MSVESLNRVQSKEKWAKIWFAKFAQFHNINNVAQWSFDNDHVIQFLTQKRNENVPTWKRKKIVEGLIFYRNRFLNSHLPRLELLKTKLSKLQVRESLLDDGRSEAEKVGKLNPNEPEIIRKLRRKLRLQGKAISTEKAYVKWVKKFMKERGLKSVDDFKDFGAKDIEAFLTDLVIDKELSPSSQDQAFYSLLYLFEHVLEKDLGSVDAMRSSKPKLTPTVMSIPEVERVLNELSGMYRTIGKLLYGCGLRISECLRLRVMDIDFDQNLIRIHTSKGNKSRLVPLPQTATKELQQLVRKRIALHNHDLANGQASVSLPYATAKKYPNAYRELKWQFLFASERLSKHPVTRKLHRHHIHPDTFPARLKQAVIDSKVNKHVTSHAFRHSFATHLLSAGTDIRTVQELLGHNDVKTTMIYTHVMTRDEKPVISPLDSLNQTPVRENAKDAIVSPNQIFESSSPKNPRLEPLEQEKPESKMLDLEMTIKKTVLANEESTPNQNAIGRCLLPDTGMTLLAESPRPTLLNRLARFTLQMLGVHNAGQTKDRRKLYPTTGSS